MKLHRLIIVFLFASAATAQHPYDFVPSDALAVLSIKNGDAVKSTLGIINEQSGLPTANPNAIDLDMFLKNPSAVDYSSQVLVILAPTKLAQGQKPTGMFGPMPHLILICKAKDGSALELLEVSGLKTTTTVDGWFIATGADQWNPQKQDGLSPILASLPNAQISAIVNFGSLWKNFGSLAQMVGGMAIGTMNRPGPDGVISPERKKATATASKGFRELTKWCATVQDLSVGLSFDKFTLVAEIDVKMKEGKDPKIDNSSLVKMSKLLSDNMMQYAMSGKLTRKLIDMDLDSLQELMPNYDGPPSYFTANIKAMADSIKGNVIAYGLNPHNGLTITGLSDVSNQDTYLEEIFGVINESTGMLLEEFRMSLSLTNTPYTWDISMIGSDAADRKVLNAVIRDDDQLRFVKHGKNRILMAFGPKTWRPLEQSHLTPLSQVMQPYAEDVDIDFAMSFDARSFIVGFSEIAKIADSEEDFSVGTSPSAISSLLFGATKGGMFIEIKSDLLGVATLIAEMDKEK